MLVVILTSIIAFVFSFLDSKEKMKYGLEAAFILLTFIGAIHYEYGNDYPSYVAMFEMYSPDSLFAPISRETFRDPGWALLCRLCKSIGFFGMVIVLNVIQNAIYYWIIKKNVPQKWYWLSVFIYVFSTNLYLINFSMMRQGFVISIFALLVPFILKKKTLIPFSVLVGLSFVHSSALLLMPFAFWGYLPIENGKRIAFVYSVLFLLFLAGGSFVNSLVSSVLSIQEISEYTQYNSGSNGLDFGIGFLGDLIPFILSLIYLVNGKGNIIQKRYVALSSIGSILIPFQQVFMMAGRIGWYFSPFKLVIYYLIYLNVKNKTIRTVLIVALLLLTLYRYFLFFNKGAFLESYSSEFQTIFSVPWM